MDLETLLYFIGVVIYFIYTAYGASQKGQKKPPVSNAEGEPIPQNTNTPSIEDLIGEYLDGPAPKPATSPQPQQTPTPPYGGEMDFDEDFEEDEYYEEEEEKEAAIMPQRKANAPLTEGRPQPTKLAVSKENKRQESYSESNSSNEYRPMQYDLFGGKNKGPSLKEKLAAAEAEKQKKRKNWLENNKKEKFKFSAKDAVIYNIIWEPKY